MNERIAKFIDNYSLLKPDSKIVLAVSGGIDSMVMAHLFYEMGFEITICHVNHGLRGKDSDRDAEFVKSFAEQRNISHYSRHIGERLENQEAGNMHAIARDMRYAFFEEIRQDQDADFIFTAHHQDDVIESMILNFFRGTGIEGLQGIPTVNGCILRPFADIAKCEITKYAKENNIAYREDVSNQSNKYTRNKIRHQLKPLLEDLFPNASQRLVTTNENIKADNLLFKKLMKAKTDRHIERSEGAISIQKALFENHETDSILLYRLIKPFGFNLSQARDIINHLGGSGQKFESQSHELFNERSEFIIKLKSLPDSSDTLNVKYGDEVVTNYFGMTLNIKYHSAENLDITNYDACLDVSKLTFPLHLRTWQPADAFAPFGLSGKVQKISKALQNYKVPTHLKAQANVLLSGSDIVWLVPYRISEHFKVDDETKEVMCISCKH